MKCNKCQCKCRLVELAACRHHCICRDCYRDTINMSTTENYDINISCPICISANTATNTTTTTTATSTSTTATTTKSNNDDDNDNNHNSSSSNESTITIHGLKLNERTWSEACSNRLQDVNKRYDTYYDYFQQYQTVFIHIPKTAGTSFEYALFNTKNRSQHAKASYWRHRIGLLQWNKSFKFAIVRHPFHRLVSGYTYWKNGALAGQEVDQPFVHRCRTDFDTLEKFVSYLLHVHQNNLWDENDIQGIDGTCPIQFRPQTWFLSEDNHHSNNSNNDNSNRLIKLDFIGRYEDLDQAYDLVKQSIKDKNKSKEDTTEIEFSDFLPHTRASFHPFDLPPIFNDPKFVSKIMEIYKSDFETFNYSI